MTSDPYDRFAPFYDAWQAAYPIPFAQAIMPFYEREILTRRTPDSSLVDLGCGTGAFLIEWAARRPDWTLSGVDVSAGMLRRARSNLCSAGVQARLTRASIQDVSSPRPVGAAVCVFDGINHLTRRIDLGRAMRSVVRMLLPGGLFVFDLIDDRAFPRLFQGEWAVMSDELAVAASARSSPKGRFGSVRFEIERLRGSSRRRAVIQIRERNWTRPEVADSIRRAGLVLIGVRRVRPYPDEEIDCPRDIFVCRRETRSVRGA